MSKYIDADILRKKIAEQMDSLPREVGRGAGTITSTGYGMMQAFQIVRTILDSLQQEQPEVDFEKEYKSYMKSRKDDLSGNVATVNVKDMVRHFYELGLNARKEE